MKTTAIALLTIDTLLLGGLLALTGCKKEAEALPACWGTHELREMKHLDGVRADFDNNSFMYKQPQELLSGVLTGRTLVCPDQANKLINLNLVDNFTTKGNQFVKIDSTRDYPYKVWGTIYQLVDINVITSFPATLLWVEKVEEVR